MFFFFFGHELDKTYFKHHIEAKKTYKRRLKHPSNNTKEGNMKKKQFNTQLRNSDLQSVNAGRFYWEDYMNEPQPSEGFPPDGNG